MDNPTCRECGTDVDEFGQLCLECNALYEQQQDEQERTIRAGEITRQISFWLGQHRASARISHRTNTLAFRITPNILPTDALSYLLMHGVIPNRAKLTMLYPDILIEFPD